MSKSEVGLKLDGNGRANRAAHRRRIVQFSITIIRKTCRSRRYPTNHSYGTVYGCSVAVKIPYRRPYNIVIRFVVLLPSALLEQAYHAKWPHAAISKSWIYHFIAPVHSLTIHAVLLILVRIQPRTTHATFP